MEWRFILVLLCAVAYATAHPMEQSEHEMELNDFETEYIPSEGAEDSVDEIQEDGYRPPEPYWASWSAWSKCIGLCGLGKQWRKRHCLVPLLYNKHHPHAHARCKGPAKQSRPCKLKPCPIDGGWSDWSSWSDCSVSCGGGTQKRTRTCTNPKPQHGGKDCVGPAMETRECNTDPCPVDGGWSKWSKFGGCSATCAGGVKTRYRTCTSPAPMYGGKPCVGPSKQTMKCNTQACPIDGAWGAWTSWSDCSASCDGGSQSRTRKCNDPAPQHGGKDCTGPSEQTRQCNTQPCPIDGEWSKWSKFGGCSATCGGGVKTRYRTCTNPAPMYGGKPCVGPSMETMPCNTQPCPIDGEWSEWGPWSKCSKTCGKGTRTRKRTCTNPAPQHGGEDCVGKPVEIGRCPIPHVPCIPCVDKYPAYKCLKYCKDPYKAQYCRKTCGLCH